MSKLKWGICAAILLFCLLMVGCRISSDTQQPLLWNLEDGHELSRVGWPPDHHTSVLQLRGAEVSIVLPEGVKIEEWQSSNVYVNQSYEDPALIDTIMLRTKPLTLDDAYIRAIELAEQLDLPREPIEKWYEERTRLGTPPFGLNHFIAVRNDFYPPLTLESAASYNDERPWIISLEIYWPHDRDSQGADR
jgi:hypothetical protein